MSRIGTLGTIMPIPAKPIAARPLQFAFSINPFAAKRWETPRYGFTESDTEGRFPRVGIFYWG